MTRKHHREEEAGTSRARPAPRPEFSRVFAIEPRMGFGADAMAFRIEAGPEERAALAVRFGLVSLDSFTAEGRLEVFEGGASARLEGHILAEVVQACVVTLEPVAAHVEDDFTLLYAKAAGAGAGAGRESEIEVEAEASDEDAPEPLPAGGIDIGEAAAECLGLALDPYPRAPDADEALAALTVGEAEAEPQSPFSVLGRLKGK
jgi:uncharacterized metal-binding protein YceD (DUF177 family)